MMIIKPLEEEEDEEEEEEEEDLFIHSLEGCPPPSLSPSPSAPSLGCGVLTLNEHLVVKWDEQDELPGSCWNR